MINTKTKLYKSLFKTIKSEIKSNNVSSLKDIYEQSRKHKKILKSIIYKETIDEIIYSNDIHCLECPLLFLAIANGGLETVLFLVEKCNADIESISQCFLQSSCVNIFHITPFFFALLCGYWHIADYLKCKGANINVDMGSYSTMYLTPLMYASCVGRLDIVKYLIENNVNNINHRDNEGDTCLTLACRRRHYDIAKYLLLNVNNIDVNEKNSHGFTALYYCCVVEGSNVYRDPFDIYYHYDQEDIPENEVQDKAGILCVVKLILDITPTAILNTVSNIKWCHHSLSMYMEISPISLILCSCLVGNNFIVEYVMSRKDIDILLSAASKRDIWLLLGCSSIDKKKNMSKGMEYWKKASSSFLSHSDDISSWMREKENLFMQRVKLENSDNIYIESLAIRQRIIGMTHDISVYYIHRRGMYYCFRENISLCLKLWLYIICKSHSYSINTIQKCIHLIYNSLSDFHLSDIINIGKQFLFPEIQKKMGINNLQCSTMFYVYILAIKLKDCQYDYNYYYTIVKNLVGEIIWLNRRDLKLHRLPILHAACTIGPFNQSRLSVDLVQLLLDSGANPNERERGSGYTPLHIIAYIIRHVNDDDFETTRDIVNILLENGAHFDSVTPRSNETFSSIQNKLRINPLRYTNLQCLAANTISKYQSQGYKFDVPYQLERFVNSHFCFRTPC